MTKQMVYDEEGVSINYSSLSEVIQTLQGMVEKYGPDAELRISECYDSIEVVVAFRREETDAEKVRRLELAARYTETRRMHFLQLKKEFGE